MWTIMGNTIYNQCNITAKQERAIYHLCQSSKLNVVSEKMEHIYFINEPSGVVVPSPCLEVWVRHNKSVQNPLMLIALKVMSD